MRSNICFIPFSCPSWLLSAKEMCTKKGAFLDEPTWCKANTRPCHKDRSGGARSHHGHDPAGDGEAACDNTTAAAEHASCKLSKRRLVSFRSCYQFRIYNQYSTFSGSEFSIRIANLGSESWTKICSYYSKGLFKKIMTEDSEDSKEKGNNIYRNKHPVNIRGFETLRWKPRTGGKRIAEGEICLKES